MNNFVVFFVISYIVALGHSTPYHMNPYNSFYQAYNPQRWGYSYGYNPYLYLHTMKARTDAVAERAACKACPETRPAPSIVSKSGLISKGKVVRIPDSTKMPETCGPVFFSGNTDIFRVPDVCCTADAGAEDWLPLEDFGSHEGIDGCYALDPFKDGAITAILVNGCYDDGTQFYGEKCGGSDFGKFSEFAYGDCGPTSPKQGSCACNLYVDTKIPGCFAIATPEADPQFAVFVKMDGCVAP